MTTAAAWQRAINNLDPAAFGVLVADEVMADDDWTTLAPSYPHGCSEIAGPDLRLLLATAALAGHRRMLATVELEAAMDEGEDDPTWAALGDTVATVAQALRLMAEPATADKGRAMLQTIVDSWDRAQQ